MAPRGLKRAASSAPMEPKAKQAFDPFKEYDVDRETFNSAVSALQHPLLSQLGINEDCRQMLSAAAPLSLCVPSDQRHQHQRLAVEMLGEVATGVEGALREAAVSAEAALAEIEGSRDGLQERVKAAGEELDGASSEAEARKRALDAASAGVLAARRALSEKQEEQRKAVALIQQSQGDQERLRAILDGPFAKLRDGEWSGNAEAKTLYAEVAKMLPKLQLDDSLVQALPSSMVKKPEERGAFDKMVSDQLQLGLQGRISGLGDSVSAMQPEGEKCASAVEGAEGALEQATSAQQDAAGELNLAQEARRKATAALDAARGALTGFEPQRKAAMDAMDSKRTALADFQSGCVASLQRLRDRSTAPAPRELQGAASVAGA